MSQKVQIYRNTSVGTKASGKYYVRAVYDEKFITTEELADFIQQQATVKKSDCKAVLDELGSAMRHYFNTHRQHRHLQGGRLQHGQRHAHGLRCRQREEQPRTVPARD